MRDPFTIWTVRQLSPRQWGAAIDYDQDTWDHPTRGPIPAPARLDFQGYCFHYWGSETLAGDEGDPDPGWTRKERLNYWLGRTFATARSGERYHIFTKGWRGGAYDGVISPWTGHLLRWRGFRDNGGQLGSHLNHTLLAIAWCGGGRQQPRKRARMTFSRMWLEFPGPVTCHCDTAGANTACPGPRWIPWVRGEGWIAELGVMRWRPAGLASKGGRVVSLCERLRGLGYYDGPRRRLYRTDLAAAVRLFQADHDLTPNGVCGPEVLRALAACPLP